MQTITYTMQKQALNEDAKSALIGALVGSGVGGLSSLLTPTDKDESKVNKILSHILAGAAMGGVAGYGIRRLNANTGAIDAIINSDEGKKDPWYYTKEREGDTRGLLTVGGAASGYGLWHDAHKQRNLERNIDRFAGNFAVGGGPGGSPSPLFNNRELNMDALAHMDRNTGNLVETTGNIRGGNSIRSSIEEARTAAANVRLRDKLREAYLRRIGSTEEVSQAVRNKYLRDFDLLADVLDNARRNASRNAKGAVNFDAATIADIRARLNSNVAASQRSAIRDIKALLRQHGNPREIIEMSRKTGKKLPRWAKIPMWALAIAGAGAAGFGGRDSDSSSGGNGK